jgi:integrase
VKGGSGAARKVASDLSMLFSFAARKHLVKINPVTEARKPKAGKRTDYLRTSEVVAIGAALDEMEAAGANKRGLDILRLIILTGCRPAEIEALKWTEVDPQQCSLMLEASKTDASARPISSEAMAIITAQPIIEGSPFVFPATRGDSHFQGSKKLWAEVRIKAKLASPLCCLVRETR